MFSASPSFNPKIDLYTVLGLTSTADDLKIKSTFYKLAKKYHPDGAEKLSDIQKDENEEKFKVVSSAYEVLRDKKKREQYDEFRFQIMNENSFKAGPGGSSQ